MEFVTAQDTKVPKLGYGTWQLEGEDCLTGVRHALDLGYRHVDTAQAYGNEELVGQAIDDSDVDRDDIFLTTKVWKDNVAPDDVIASTEESLNKLDTGWIDLLLIHWPVEDVPFEKTLDAMMELVEQDKVRHIGVSNFTPTQLKRAADHAPIVCNQVEYHPFLNQDDLLDIVDDRDMFLTAYSPLARGRVLEDETLREIADGHDKSPAQIAIRWLFQQDNVAAIPKAAGADHRRENFDIFDFKLSPEEMERIDWLTGDDRIIDPSFAPNWQD